MVCNVRVMELLKAIESLKGEGKENLAKLLGIDVEQLKTPEKKERKTQSGSENDMTSSGLKVDPPENVQKLINDRVAIFRKMTKGMCLGGGTGAVKSKDWAAWFQTIWKHGRHPLIAPCFKLEVDGVGRDGSILKERLGCSDGGQASGLGGSA